MEKFRFSRYAGGQRQEPFSIKTGDVDPTKKREKEKGTNSSFQTNYCCEICTKIRFTKVRKFKIQDTFSCPPTFLPIVPLLSFSILQLLHRGSFSSTGMKNKENVYNVLPELNFWIQFDFHVFWFQFWWWYKWIEFTRIAGSLNDLPLPKKLNQCFSWLQSQSARFKVVM